MLKWVGRVLYIVLILYLTYQVYGFAYFAKLQSYYEEVVLETMDEDLAYLEGMVTLMGLDYVQRAPLYTYENLTGDYQLKVAVHAIGATVEDELIDGFLIFVNNLSITEDGAAIVNPAIKITVGLSDESLYDGETYISEGSRYYNPDNPFSYYNVPVLLLFETENFLKIPDSETIATVESISVTHISQNPDNNGEDGFSTQPMFIANTSQIDEAVHGDNKDTLILDPEGYRLSDDFADGYPTQTELEAYDLSAEKGDMSGYNGVIFRTMSIYLLFVIVISYFLFFHKSVRERMRMRGVRTKTAQELASRSLFKDYEEPSKK
jgi:hypothetical protein